MSHVPKKVITFVIGSACSGKSTLAGYLGRKGHGITFRASEYLAKYVEKNFKGKELSDFIGSDFLAHIPNVDDAKLLCSGIEGIVLKESRVIIDGYPRSLHQMFTLQDSFRSIAQEGHTIRVINLVVPVPELLRRMYKRNRHYDTEARILAEVEIHIEIARILRDMAAKNDNMTFVEFVVPDGADDVEVKRDFTEELTGKMQGISFIDSISRRINEVFSELEYKRTSGFSKQSSASVHL